MLHNKPGKGLLCHHYLYSLSLLTVYDLLHTLYQIFLHDNSRVSVFCPETLCTESVKWSVYRLYSICHYLKIHSYSWDLRSKINVLRPTNFNRSATLLGIFLQALHFWKQHLISCRFCSNKENEFTWCVRFVSCIRRCNDGLHASSHLIPRMCMFSES